MVEIIYESKENIDFFIKALEEIDIPYRLNFIEEFELDLNQPPDNIIYLNQVSPLAYMRDNNLSLIKCEQYLDYLAAFNRKVINGINTIGVESSRVEKYRLFKQQGLLFPHTVFSSDKEALIKMTHSMSFPLQLIHNRSTMQTDTEKFETLAELTSFLYSDNLFKAPDSVYLVQKFVEPKNNIVTVVQLMNYKLVYAYEKTCEVEPKYKLLKDFNHPLLAKYIEIAKSVRYDMVRFEMVEAMSGSVYTNDMHGLSQFPKEIEQDSGSVAKQAFQEMIEELKQ